jgi:hypothetical protein
MVIKIDEIRKMPVKIDPEYPVKGSVGWEIHESLFRSYHILEKVKDLLMKDVDSETIIELIELMENEDPEPEPKKPIKVIPVESDSRPDLCHEVSFWGDDEDGHGDWECSCEAFKYSKESPRICKHIIKVKKQWYE